MDTKFINECRRFVYKLIFEIVILENSSIKGYYGNLHYLLKPENLVKYFYPDIIWRLPIIADEKVISITFDDGPSPCETPRILRILRE